MVIQILFEYYFDIVENAEKNISGIICIILLSIIMLIALMGALVIDIVLIPFYLIGLIIKEKESDK